MPSPELISDTYRREQERLHAAPQGYGGKGRKWADLVESLIRAYGCKSLLDYGAGQGSLALELASRGVAATLALYDPAVPQWAALPDVADLVVCTDVLEHVEPDKVDAVVEHLATLTQAVLFVVVSTIPTAKTLSDGRQAHISLHDRAWWSGKLSQHFRQIEEYAISPNKQWVAVLMKKDV